MLSYYYRRIRPFLAAYFLTGLLTTAVLALESWVQVDWSVWAVLKTLMSSVFFLALEFVFLLCPFWPTCCSCPPNTITPNGTNGLPLCFLPCRCICFCLRASANISFGKSLPAALILLRWTIWSIRRKLLKTSISLIR